MKTQQTQAIRFCEKHLATSWVTSVEDLYVDLRTIVVNLGEERALLPAPPAKYLSPRTSTILKETRISGADSLLLIEVKDETNIGGVVLDPQWNQLGAIADYPKDVPLWKSAQYEVGTVRFDPFHVTGATVEPRSSRVRTYAVKVNLWFSPAKTNCGLHNHHTVPEMLEVHTQIYGVGRMQKFHAESFDTLYQDVVLGPGETHIPFAGVDEKGGFVYPWHQYYADTDCIWMANEFHPID